MCDEGAVVLVITARNRSSVSAGVLPQCSTSRRWLCTSGRKRAPSILRSHCNWLTLAAAVRRITNIVKLTTDHVHDDGDQVKVVLGTSPVVLPEPVAGLIRDLVATRQGHATIGRPDTTLWLFPGGRPGQPIGDDRLGMRLHSIGLHPRQARSTALFTLATELPAAILARMLGIHIQVAVQWQKAAAGDWMTYAADVSSRPAKDTVQ